MRWKNNTNFRCTNETKSNQSFWKLVDCVEFSSVWTRTGDTISKQFPHTKTLVVCMFFWCDPATKDPMFICFCSPRLSSTSHFAFRAGYERISNIIIYKSCDCVFLTTSSFLIFKFNIQQQNERTRALSVYDVSEHKIFYFVFILVFAVYLVVCFFFRAVVECR